MLASCVVCNGAKAGSLARRSRKKQSAVTADPEASAVPAQTPIGPVDVLSRWAIIVDFTTGTLLMEKQADDEAPPSSLTKLMTAYIVFKNLASGHLSLSQSLPVSERAWRMQGSKMFVPLGQQVKVDDLIRGMIIQSGNDACIVLAEGIAGSEDQFVKAMNDEARRLQLTHTEFRNATGWPDPDHHMSVRDIATLAAALIRDFPQYYHFFGERSYTFDNIDQGNRNVLVDKGLADGLKTGHTEAGGFALCASASRDGRRVIMVLNGLPSARSRVEEGERLLEWSFNSFADVTLSAAAETVQSVPVWLGAKPTVNLVSVSNVVVTVPRGSENNLQVTVTYDTPAKAPIRRGQTLGQLRVGSSSGQARAVDLVASDAVGRMALPLRSLAVIEHAVVGG